MPSGTSYKNFSFRLETKDYTIFYDANSSSLVPVLFSKKDMAFTVLTGYTRNIVNGTYLYNKNAFLKDNIIYRLPTMKKSTYSQTVNVTYSIVDSLSTDYIYLDNITSIYLILDCYEVGYVFSS